MMTEANQAQLQKYHGHGHGGSSNPVYGLGMIGAWVYYFQKAQTTEERIKAFFKGLVWPAFLVYELFSFLKVDQTAEEKPAE